MIGAGSWRDDGTSWGGCCFLDPRMILAGIAEFVLNTKNQMYNTNSGADLPRPIWLFQYLAGVTVHDGGRIIGRGAACPLALFLCLAGAVYPLGISRPLCRSVWIGA